MQVSNYLYNFSKISKTNNIKYASLPSYQLLEKIFFNNKVKFKLITLCFTFFGSDKILINRRNVVTEVKKNYAACRQFLEVELDARILAAALLSSC